MNAMAVNSSKSEGPSSSELAAHVHPSSDLRAGSAWPWSQDSVEILERLAAIVESSDDAIISKALDGTILSWNRGAERIFGYTAEETVGRHISMIAAPDRIDEIPQILARLARGERVDHYETKRRTKDGRILTVSLTVSPIRDASGVVIGASKIARDITSREQHRRELEQSNAALETANAALEKANAALERANVDLQHFAYSASHDLQEPLRMVAAYSGMLKSRFAGQLDETGAQCIEYIALGAEKMRQLLNDLLAFTRVSAIDPADAKPIDAGEALNGALKALDPAIHESGAVITRGPLPAVRLHEFQLHQLFQNLIGNAIRYRGSDPPRIHVAAERSGDYWLFSFQDNGIGIDPQYKEQIFEMFRRLHGPAEYPGTGMGLAICQRIVERSGGRIWVESEPGRGSTFFFTIPA